MRLIMMLMCTMTLLAWSAATTHAEVAIKGAGASFPYPLYAWWSLRHGKETDTKIYYDSIGSGGGIKRILAKDVDFGATDAPLTPEELQKHGLIQFATVLGGVVPVIHVPGIKTGELKLTGPLLAKIFMGEISYWDNQEIQQFNTPLTLPHLPISVVCRSKGSGTTWIFTNYLSKVSARFNQSVGNNKLVQWPVGSSARGNEGIINKVQATAGAIGYTEYAYAVQSKTNYVTLMNKSKQFVQPNRESFQAAAASVDWSKASADIILTNREGEQAWPITGATFILMHKTQMDTAKTKALLRFFQWCYTEGDTFADYLDYVPLPDVLTTTIQKGWLEVQDRHGNSIHTFD